MGVFIGTSGWSYNHWAGILYPDGLAPTQRLGYYVQQYQTVELNSSFYQWPKQKSFRAWNKRLPEGFAMSVKAPSLLTHVRRLYSPEVWMNQIKRCWHELRDRRAVLLVQLSPKFEFDYRRLEYFLQQIPEWMKVAVEFRHSSWHNASVFSLLEHYQTAYCVMSGAQLPCILQATAPFVYVRMHGPDQHHLYGGSYSANDLHWWGDRIMEWKSQGKDVYVYFNNDGEGNAVRNASALRTIIH